MQRLSEPFDRLAQLAGFAQRAEVEPIGLHVGTRTGRHCTSLYSAAALLEFAPAAARAGIVAAGSFGRRRSGAARGA